MKRLLLTVAWIVLITAPCVHAQEPPEAMLEFVRGLRDKRYADLGLEYLERLQKNPPAALKPLLSMELAKTRIALAMWRMRLPGERCAMLHRLCGYGSMPGRARRHLIPGEFAIAASHGMNLAHQWTGTDFWLSPGRSLCPAYWAGD